MKQTKKNCQSSGSNPIFAKIVMRKSSLLFSSLLAISGISNAQISRSALLGQELNVITTMVPFLTISPDSRSAGMGDVGVAMFNPDANSTHWNTANLAFATKQTGFSVSYAPWLRQLVDDVGFSYLSGYSKLGKNSAVSGSFRYFSLGNINFTDMDGNPTGSFNPNEFALDLGYTTRFSDAFAMGVSLRYIYSNIVGSGLRNGIDYTAGTSVAGDINMIYKNQLKVQGKRFRYNFGANIQNIGAKMTYSSREKRDFIPTNLKLGLGVNYEIDAHNEVNFYLDINKLLVPTRPFYLQNYNNTGDSIDIGTGKPVIIGLDPNVGVVQGMAQSFYDAPGGFKEEMNEITPSFGLEYLYDKTFAVRTGVFYEAQTKGARQYLTLGMGLKFQSLTLDAAYLVPFRSRHPLQNQMRFSLLFDLAALSDQ